MADTTLPALLSTGDHASRPAASAVGTGALYSCTDHALVYQTDGSSWTTWASLGGGGIQETLIDAAGDLIVGSAADTAARLAIGTNGYVLTSNGTTAAWAAAAGGSGVSGKAPVQDKATGSGANGSSRAITLDAAPTNGNLLVAVISAETQAVSSISQTNVTWTLVRTSGAGTDPRVEIWKGVVAASGSASITINFAGSTYNGAVVSEWNGITGTEVNYALISGLASGSNGLQAPYTPVFLNTSANALVIGGSTCANNGTYRKLHGNVCHFVSALNAGSSVAAAYAFPGTTPVQWSSNTGWGGASAMSALVVSLT